MNNIIISMAGPRGGDGGTAQSENSSMHVERISTG